MKLQQLRFACEVVQNGLNFTQAAERLATSQPGISKQIRQLEEELGIDIFVRNGKRIIGLTPPGRDIIEVAQRILRESDDLLRISAEFTNQSSGSLTIATTHTQARYALPPVIQRFRERYANVRLALYQGSPTQICEHVVLGNADLAIATEGIELYEQLVMLPCYQWNRSILVQPGHPLLEIQRISLEDVARYPIVTYDFAFAGRSKINRAFEARGLTPNVVLTAIDADIIKTYVELGLGVGILASMAYDPIKDTGLRAIDASHLFAPSTTRIGILKNAYLRGYTFDFIETFAPHLTRQMVEDALHGSRDDPA